MRIHNRCRERVSEKQVLQGIGNVMPISKRNKWIAGIIVFLFLAVLGGVYMGIKHQQPSSLMNQIAKELPESFTFFDLGSNTRFSSTVQTP